jgi:hypothetical protein
MKTQLILILIFFSILPLHAQYPFKEIPFQEKTNTFLLTKTLTYTVLFKTGDTVFTNTGKLHRGL